MTYFSTALLVVVIRLVHSEDLLTPSNNGLYVIPWTEEDLCILRGKTRCPVGFEETTLRLSMQPDVNPKDRDIGGKDLMALGRAGGSFLNFAAYDQLYTLNLIVCCKK